MVANITYKQYFEDDLEARKGMNWRLQLEHP